MGEVELLKLYSQVLSMDHKYSQFEESPYLTILGVVTQVYIPLNVLN